VKFEDEISLGFIYIGTVVGAGFATGQEIVGFFTGYGLYGLLGIAITSILFFLFGFFIFRLALNNRSSCIGDILLPYSGKFMLKVFEIIVGVFSLAGFYIMVTGCAAVLEQSLGFPSFPVVLALDILCVLWLQRGSQGLGDINRILVSIMLVLTLWIGIKSLKEGWILWQRLDFSHYQKGWLFSAIIYFSYNMTLALVVIGTLGTYTRRRGAALGAAFIGAIGLFIMGFVLWFITTVYYSYIIDVEVPLLWVASHHGPALYWSAIVVLLSAMLTTALGLGFSFIKGISRAANIPLELASYSLLLGIPLARFTFSKLIEKVYPLFGIIGIILLFLILCRRVLGLNIE